MNLGMATETLEFKKSTSEIKEAIQSIGAILNKHQHGEVYFGVKPDGTVIGQTVTEETLRQVSQKIKNFIEPKIYPEVRRVVLDGRECVHVRFSGTQTPYFVYNIARMRVADEDIVMTREEITQLLLQSGREGNRWESLVSNKTIDDVDEEILKKYIQQAHDNNRIPIVYSDKRTVLNQLEVIEDDYLLNSGKVLFSDDLLQDIQLAIFATEERVTFNDIQRYHGSILKLVDLAETYIKTNIRWRVEFNGDLQRKEIPEIPIEAVREALLNSFCHKDYSVGESNEVAIYPDRIEIYNPGTFPNGLDPEDYIDRIERPVRRNPQIARLLYYSKDIESFGTGLRRIAQYCKMSGVRYEFQKKKTGFVVCFYRNKMSTVREAYDVLEDGDKKPITPEKADKKPITPQKADKKPIKIHQLTVEQERIAQIIDYINVHGEITNREARELLGLADSTTKRFLRKMVAQSLLVVEGTRKMTRYRLASKNE